MDRARIRVDAVSRSLGVNHKRRVRHKHRAIGWDRFPFEYLPLAFFYAGSDACRDAAGCRRSGQLHWQRWLKPIADGLYRTPAARDWGVLTPGLVIRIAANAIAGLIVVSILALFEEIG